MESLFCSADNIDCVSWMMSTNAMHAKLHNQLRMINNRLCCETRKKQLWVKSQPISAGKLEDNYNLEIRDYQLSIELQMI